ncbi:hypothetical protein Q4493_01275 [Colwellia sp. 1_MG-2023]|uniref:hypothetical protein n=1 Tax=Colwellia sp. 1_MG-2023 TaxID=3062649 RepID=UPI0026E40EF9|nr:hypothetical protein [Colwellia sp. 1_MG-2023]MDO6444396.1 hypothetical protein [Colwellia sp. 1_MG-2023]
MLANIELISDLLSKAKVQIAQEEYEQAQDTVKRLEQAIKAIFAHDNFDKNLFLLPSSENLSLRTVLLEADEFFQNEIKILTNNSKKVVDELSSIKAANKMKKAYGA